MSLSKKYAYRRSINLSDDHKRQLQIMSKRSGLRETEIIRIAIAEYWHSHYEDSDLEPNKNTETMSL